MEDVAMRNYDFAPLWRSTVGFDHLFDLINSAHHAENHDNYPPYDIARTGEDTYRISLAVAGFSPGDLTVRTQQNLLTVSGRKSEHSDRQYIYQGISERPFERRFSLADHVEVASAGFENGLLQIELVPRLPEAVKPRRIEIGTGVAADKPEQGKARIRAAA
jgi:molecular chaperone IbpA